MYAFDKYGAERNVGLERGELIKVATVISGYFSAEENKPLYIEVVKNGKPYALFNEREAIHMQDVKGLIDLSVRVHQLSLAYVLGFVAFLLALKAGKFWRYLLKYAAFGSGLTLTALLLIGLAALFGFSQLFLLFHVLSFSNDLWILDPRTDNLIRMFPEEFFFDVTISFVAMTIAEAVVVVGLAIALLSRKHGKEARHSTLTPS